MHPKNHGKDWTKSDVNKLEYLAKKGIDTDKIANELGRTKIAIYKKASEEEIPLKPRDKLK